MHSTRKTAERLLLAANVARVARLKRRRKIPRNLPPVPDWTATDSTRFWYAIRWDFTRCEFDRATLRTEPDTSVSYCNDPRLFRQPYMFPWIYLPYCPQVYEMVDWLNTKCNWQTPVQLVRDHVETVGGVLIALGGIVPEHVPPPRYRKPVTQRIRNLTRASDRPHTVAKNAIRREGLRWKRQPDMNADTQHRVRVLQVPPVPIRCEWVERRQQGPQTHEWTPAELQRLEEIIMAGP